MKSDTEHPLLGDAIARLNKTTQLTLGVRRLCCRCEAFSTKDHSVLGWLRRIIVSIGIGGASYAIMLTFMVLSVIYDRQFEPIITFAFDTGRWIVDTLDTWVAGNRWGQIAVNHLVLRGQLECINSPLAMAK